MTPWVGRWQTASGPLYYKQTNQRLQLTASNWISPPASQLQAAAHASLFWVCERENQYVIIFTFSLAGDTGGRHGIETTRSAQWGHRRPNTFKWYLSVFHLFHSGLIQNLPRLYLTEVTLFQSTWLLSQIVCSEILFGWFDWVEVSSLSSTSLHSCICCVSLPVSHSVLSLSTQTAYVSNKSLIAAMICLDLNVKYCVYANYLAKGTIASCSSHYLLYPEH